MESQSFSFLLLVRGNTTIKSFEIFSASKNLNLEAYIDTTILMQFSPRFKNVHLVCLVFVFLFSPNGDSLLQSQQWKRQNRVKSLQS